MPITRRHVFATLGAIGTTAPIVSVARVRKREQVANEIPSLLRLNEANSFALRGSITKLRLSRLLVTWSQKKGGWIVTPSNGGDLHYSATCFGPYYWQLKANT